jgi:hypothetical protein
MRYLIILAGRRGEVDRREVEDEDQIREVALSLIAASGYLAGGDTIGVVDTEAPRDDVVDLYMVASSSRAIDEKVETQ